jgi:hypothetical protein
MARLPGEGLCGRDASVGGPCAPLVSSVPPRGPPHGAQTTSDVQGAIR